MPRRHRRASPGRMGDPAPPGMQRVEQYGGVEYVVRRVSGGDSGRVYRCPGCDQEVLAGTPHVVAWPADAGLAGSGGPADRRHWHTPCWTCRDRRGPRR
jgi:hypothetical protein